MLLVQDNVSFTPTNILAASYKFISEHIHITFHHHTNHVHKYHRYIAKLLGYIFMFVSGFSVALCIIINLVFAVSFR